MNKPGIYRMSLSYKFVLILWIVVMLLFRPSWVGHYFSLQLLVLFGLLSAVLFSLTPSPPKFYFESHKMRIFVLVCIVLTYFFIQGMLISSAKQIVINASILTFGQLVCIALILRNWNQAFILKTFIWIHVVFSVSTIISMSLLVVTGFNWNLITLFHFPESYYRGIHSLVFPFSIVYGTIPFLGMKIGRFSSIYAEAGSAQIFFLTAYFFTFFIKMRYHKLLQSILLLGVILTFSTAGMINLGVAFVVYVLFNTNVLKILKGKIHRYTLNLFIISLPFLLGVILVLFILPTGINLFNKLEAYSGNTRTSHIQAGAELFLEKPVWGWGYYHSMEKNDDRNAKYTIGTGFFPVQVGLIGTGLYLLAWWYSVSILGSRQTLSLYIPTFVTLLVFQPTFNTVFVWFLLLLNTSDFQAIGLNKKNSLR